MIQSEVIGTKLIEAGCAWCSKVSLHKTTITSIRNGVQLDFIAELLCGCGMGHTLVMVTDLLEEENEKEKTAL